MKRLVVLLALAAVVAALLLLDRRRPTSSDIRRAAEALAPDLDTGAVDRITIERAGVTLVLARKNGVWWLDSDGNPSLRADDAAAEAVLSTLRYGRVERLVDTTLRVKLDRARLRAGSVDLQIGEDAAGRGVYARRGVDLLVAESRLAEVVAAEFRSKSAVLDDVGSAGAVQVGPLALERHHGGWRVIEPRPALADPAPVQQLLSALTAARADSFRPGPAPSPAPGEQVIAFDGRLQARIRPSGDGGVCDKMTQVDRADGAVLCFSEASLAPLHVRVDDLRLPRLTSLALDEIDAVDFEISGRQLSLRRAGHEWRITAPAADAGPAEDALVRERLQGLLELRARAFGPPGASSLGHIRLAGAGDEVQVALARSGYEILAQRQSEDSALILPAASIKLFDPDPLSLRSRRVDTFRPDSVTAVSLDGAALSLGSPRADAIVRDFADLHAQAVQRRNFTARHNLRITAAGSVHTFLLGPCDADGCLLKTKEDGPAFVVGTRTSQNIGD
jgi:hypothetical protein